MKIELELIPDGHDDDGAPIMVDIEHMVATTVANRICSTVERHVMKEVEAQLKLKIVDKVDEWMNAALSKNLQKTDCYGQSKGEPISFAEHITGLATDYLSTKVDREGRSGYSDKCRTRLEWAVRNEAEVIIKTELKNNLAEHREALTKLFTDALAEAATALTIK